MTIKLEDFIGLVNNDFNNIKKIAPIFGDLETIIEDNDSHKNYSVYEHIKKVYKNTVFFLDSAHYNLKRNTTLTDRTRNILLLKCLLHDIGKVDTGLYRGDQKIFPNHELRGSELAEPILEKIELTEEERLEVTNFVKYHTDIHKCLDGGAAKFEENLNNFKKNHGKTEDFIIFCLADIHESYLKESNPEEYTYRINTLLGAL